MQGLGGTRCTRLKSSPWTCANEGGPFVVGVAWKGSLCYDNRYGVDGGSNNGKGFRTSINSRVTSDLGLAMVINTLTNPLSIST